MHLIFVYGTLKRGFQNDRLRAPGARFVARCAAVERYPLVIGGQWFSPYLLDAPGEGFSVSGELFEAEDADLANLDRLEGTGVSGGYRRIALPVRSDADRAILEALTHAKSPAEVSPVHDGPLAAYPKDPRYVPPRERTRIFG